MSDPDVEREIAANEARDRAREDNEPDGGLLNPLGRAFSSLLDDDTAPGDSADAEQRRRANDEAVR